MSNLNLHENLSREDDVVGSSDRAFGLTFAVIGALIGGIKLWRGAWPMAELWLAAAAVFLLLALFWPNSLAPLNRLWLKLSLLLYKIVNPVIMALLFFTTITPIGLLMRARGKDLLRQRRDPALPSYWIDRDQAEAARQSMKNQF